MAVLVTAGRQWAKLGEWRTFSFLTAEKHQLSTSGMAGEDCGSKEMAGY